MAEGQIKVLGLYSYYLLHSFCLSTYFSWEILQYFLNIGQFNSVSYWRKLQNHSHILSLKRSVSDFRYVFILFSLKCNFFVADIMLKMFHPCLLSLCLLCLQGNKILNRKSYTSDFKTIHMIRVQNILEQLIESMISSLNPGESWSNNDIALS